MKNRKQKTKNKPIALHLIDNFFNIEDETYLQIHQRTSRSKERRFIASEKMRKSIEKKS